MMRLERDEDRSHPSGVTRVVAVSVAVAGVLAGCTSVNEPMVSPSPVVSAVVTPSPSPSLSHEEQMLALIPEEAKGDDLFAAEAMAKFFVTLNPGLYQTGETSLWEFVCLPESEFCSSTVEVSRARIKSGEWQVGGEIVVPEQLTDLVLDYEAEIPTAYVGLKFEQQALSIVDDNGETLRTKVATIYEVALRLKFVDGLWRVSGVEVVAPEHD